MIVPVRWCHNYRKAKNIANPEKHLEQPRFDGVGIEVHNELMEIYHHHLPFSVNRSGSHFDYPTKTNYSYSRHSCLEAASSNITDVLVLFPIYPSNIELDKVYPYQQLTDNYAIIVTA